MPKYYRLVVAEERNGETHWREVGAMFPKDDGSFFMNLYLFDKVIRAYPDEGKTPKDPAKEPKGK